MQTRTIDIHGEIEDKLIDSVVRDLRNIFEYNKFLLDTFVNPIKEIIQVVELDIDSPGGYVTGFTRIKKEIDKLKEQGVHIKTYVSGHAYSCGFVIALLGDERSGSEFCQLMNHQASGFSYGKTSDKYRKAKLDLKMEQKFIDFIVERTDLTKEYLEERIEINDWFDYDDCVECGIFTKETDKKTTEVKLSEVIAELVENGYEVVDDLKEEIKEEVVKEEVVKKPKTVTKKPKLKTTSK